MSEEQKSLFKLTIEQIEFFHALQQIKTAIGTGKRCLTPHDKFIYLEVQATVNGPVLILRATAGGDFKEIQLPITYGNEGVLPLVDFKNLYDVVSTIQPTYDIEISEEEFTGNVILNYTGRKEPMLFAAVPSVNFPKFPTVTDSELSLSIPVEELEKIINLMSQYIAESASNPVLACMNIKIENGILKASGIDDKTKRFAYAEIKTTSTTEGEFMIEAGRLKKVFNGFDPAYDVRINVTPGHITFAQQHLRISLSRIAGALPDITRFTHAQPRAALTFNKYEMMNALDRAKVFVDDSNFQSRVVKIDFDNGFSSMKLDTATGKLSETVITNLNGKAFSINFLVDSLYQSIKSIDDDNILMCFASTSGGIVSPATQSSLYEDHRVLVQSVKTQ